MIAENPLALAYILPNDVFILPDEKQAFLNTISQETTPVEPEIATPVVQVQEPTISYITPAQPVAEPALQSIPAIPKITTTTVVAETSAVAFKHAGGFGQKFLIIVHYPTHEIMDPAHQSALENTIKRKELSLEDVAIFNIGKYPGTDIKAIGRFFKPKRMLLLGKESFPEGLVTPVFNQLTMLGTCQLLYSFSFIEMMGNKDQVKAFWEQMKLL